MSMSCCVSAETGGHATISGLRSSPRVGAVNIYRCDIILPFSEKGDVAPAVYLYHRRLVCVC